MGSTAVRPRGPAGTGEVGPRSTHQWWWVVSTVVSFTPCFLTVSTTCNQTGGIAQAGYAPAPAHPSACRWGRPASWPACPASRRAGRRGGLFSRDSRGSSGSTRPLQAPPAKTTPYRQCAKGHKAWRRRQCWKGPCLSCPGSLHAGALSSTHQSLWWPPAPHCSFALITEWRDTSSFFKNQMG